MKEFLRTERRRQGRSEYQTPEYQHTEQTRERLTNHAISHTACIAGLHSLPWCCVCRCVCVCVCISSYVLCPAARRFKAKGLGGPTPNRIDERKTNQPRRTTRKERQEKVSRWSTDTECVCVFFLASVCWVWFRLARVHSESDLQRPKPNRPEHCTRWESLTTATSTHNTHAHTPIINQSPLSSLLVAVSSLLPPPSSRHDECC